jgi:hypothetical protein
MSTEVFLSGNPPSLSFMKGSNIGNRLHHSTFPGPTFLRVLLHGFQPPLATLEIDELVIEAHHGYKSQE